MFLIGIFYEADNLKCSGGSIERIDFALREGECLISEIGDNLKLFSSSNTARGDASRFIDWAIGELILGPIGRYSIDYA